MREICRVFKTLILEVQGDARRCSVRVDKNACGKTLTVAGYFAGGGVGHKFALLLISECRASRHIYFGYSVFGCMSKNLSGKEKG